jgi:hypothetical protein
MCAVVRARGDPLPGLRQRMIVAARRCRCHRRWIGAQHQIADDSCCGDAAQREHEGNNQEAVHDALSAVYAAGHSDMRLRRKAFEITDTELSVIAALAQIGLIRVPVNGYSAPAATGTPTAL